MQKTNELQSWRFVKHLCLIFSDYTFLFQDPNWWLFKNVFSLNFHGAMLSFESTMCFSYKRNARFDTSKFDHSVTKKTKIWVISPVGKKIPGFPLVAFKGRLREKRGREKRKMQRDQNAGDWGQIGGAVVDCRLLTPPNNFMGFWAAR